MIVVPLTLIIIFLSRRIDSLVHLVTAFSQNTLGSKRALPKSGDQLYHLEKRIKLLTKEMLAARQALCLQYEMKQKAERLQVLEVVTQKLGVGVQLHSNEGKEQKLNQQMIEFETNFAEQWGSVTKIRSDGEVVLQDRQQQRHILKVSRLTLFEASDVMLVQDITEQRLAEKITQESEERFRNITEAASDAIISINIMGEMMRTVSIFRPIRKLQIITLQYL